MRYLYLVTFYGGHSKISITTRPLGCRLDYYLINMSMAITQVKAVSFDGITVDELHAIAKDCLIATRDFFYTEELRAKFPSNECRYHKTPDELWSIMEQHFPTGWKLVTRRELENVSNDCVDEVKQPPAYFQSCAELMHSMPRSKMIIREIDIVD